MLACIFFLTFLFFENTLRMQSEMVHDKFMSIVRASNFLPKGWCLCRENLCHTDSQTWLCELPYTYFKESTITRQQGSVESLQISGHAIRDFHNCYIENNKR